MKQKRKILIVDDCLADIILIKRQLKQAGIEGIIHSVDAGERLVEIIKQLRYDYIISDYNLLNETGLSFFRRLKLNHVKVKFVLISDKIEENLRDEAYDEGVYMCVEKSDLGKRIGSIFG